MTIRKQKYLVINKDQYESQKDQVIIADVAHKGRSFQIIFLEHRLSSDEEMGPTALFLPALRGRAVRSRAERRGQNAEKASGRTIAGNGKMIAVTLMRARSESTDTEMRNSYSIDTAKRSRGETNCLLRLFCEWQRARLRRIQMASVLR